MAFDPVIVSRACFIGRWNCVKTARIYITDALASSPNWRLNLLFWLGSLDWLDSSVSTPPSPPGLGLRGGAQLVDLHAFALSLCFWEALCCPWGDVWSIYLGDAHCFLGAAVLQDLSILY